MWWSKTSILDYMDLNFKCHNKVHHPQLVPCIECKCLIRVSDAHVERTVAWKRMKTDVSIANGFAVSAAFVPCESSHPDARSEVTETRYCQRCKPVKSVKKKGSK